MNGIIDFANKPILNMGAPIIMLIVLTLLALLFRSEILQNAKVVKLAIATYRYQCNHRYVEWSFLASLTKFVETLVFSEYHRRYLGTTCYHHPESATDTATC